MKRFVILLVFVFCNIADTAQAHVGHHIKEVQTKPILGESIYNLKSEWTSQDGKTMSLKDLRGRPAVLAMAYTSCEEACPLIVEDMKRMRSGLSEASRNKFSFLIFSIDSNRDTPAILKQYAAKRKLELGSWLLFHGDQRAVRELAAVLGIRFKKDKKTGDFDHSNMITLLNSEGLIQFQLNGLNQDSKEFLMMAERERPSPQSDRP
jgi:protein SCO1/2